MFISFEGCEASGKSTQAAILRDHITSLGKEVFLTKEPGGTELAEQIRQILLAKEIRDPLTELLLLSAARRDHIAQIKKELSLGKVVISDRFADSSLAYQGYAKGIDINFIQELTSLISDNFQPDITLLLNADLPVVESRLKKENRSNNNFYDEKNIDFHNKIKLGFLEIAKLYPERIIVIDSNNSVTKVAQEIWEIVNGKMQKV